MPLLLVTSMHLARHNSYESQNDMIRQFFAIMVSLLVVVSPGFATEQPMPNDVVLTLEFADKSRATLALSMADLQALPLSTVTTRTPWHDGEQIFEGVALSDLVASVAAKGTTLRVKALNGYETEVPFSDFIEHGPVLAYRLNGKPMAVAEKGPLFIIYAFDDKPELNSELFFSRSAWQVSAMTIE